MRARARAHAQAHLVKALSASIPATETDGELALACLRLLADFAVRLPAARRAMSGECARAIVLSLHTHQRDTAAAALACRTLRELSSEPNFFPVMDCGQLLAAAMSHALAHVPKAEAEPLVLDAIAALGNLDAGMASWVRAAVAALKDVLGQLEDSAAVALQGVALLNRIVAQTDVELPGMKDVFQKVLYAATEHLRDANVLRECLVFLSAVCARTDALLEPAAGIDVLDFFKVNLMTVAFFGLASDDAAYVEAAARLLLLIARFLAPAGAGADEGTQQTRAEQVITATLSALQSGRSEALHELGWEVVEAYVAGAGQNLAAPDAVAGVLAELQSRYAAGALAPGRALDMLGAVVALPRVVLTAEASKHFASVLFDLIIATARKPVQGADDGSRDEETAAEQRSEEEEEEEEAASRVVATTQALLSLGVLDAAELASLGDVVKSAVDLDHVALIARGEGAEHSRWLRWTVDRLIAPDRAGVLGLFNEQRALDLKDHVRLAVEFDGAAGFLERAVVALAHLATSGVLPADGVARFLDMVVDVVYVHVDWLGADPTSGALAVALSAFGGVIAVVADSPRWRHLASPLELRGLCGAQEQHAAPLAALVLRSGVLLRRDAAALDDGDVVALRRLAAFAQVPRALAALKAAQLDAWGALEALLVTRKSLDTDAVAAELVLQGLGGLCSAALQGRAAPRELVAAAVAAAQRDFAQPKVVAAALELLLQLCRAVRLGAKSVLDAGGVELFDRVLEKKGL